MTTSLPNQSQLVDFLNKNPSTTNLLKIDAIDSNQNPVYDISSGPVSLTLDLPDLDLNSNYVLCKYDSNNRIMKPQPRGYPAPLVYNNETGKYTTSFKFIYSCPFNFRNCS